MAGDASGDALATDAAADTSTADRIASVVLGILYAIRGSFFVFFAALGVLMVVTGALLWRGELAGILGVLGASAILYGIIGRVALKLIRY